MEQSNSNTKASHEAKCSLCGHPFPGTSSKTFPFCSARCQQIDLGEWLEERIGLPIEGQEDLEFTGFDDDQDDQNDQA